jgi:hypothetical protein
LLFCLSENSNSLPGRNQNRRLLREPRHLPTNYHFLHSRCQPKHFSRFARER